MYIELQTYSNFSFLRGASHPEELVNQAADLGYKAISLTDRHSVAGIVRAHFEAKKRNISFIVGTEIILYENFPETKTQRNLAPEYIEVLPSEITPNCLPLSVLLYPTSKQAYATMCRLLTIGKRRAPKGKCFLCLQDLLLHNQGLLAVAVIHSFKHPELLGHLEKLKKIFNSDRLSLRLVKNYGPDNDKNFYRTLEISKLLGIPLVATNEVYYHRKQLRELQDVLCCI
jgi:error-prone DNA polymerase